MMAFLAVIWLVLFVMFKTNRVSPCFTHCLVLYVAIPYYTPLMIYAFGPVILAINPFRVQTFEYDQLYPEDEGQTRAQ